MIAKSVRWYLVAGGLSAVSIACTILGDRAAKREIKATKTWEDATVDVKSAEGNHFYEEGIPSGVSGDDS